MQYRNFGKLDFKPSVLGFGLMRLPVVGNDSAKIDYPQAEEMIRYAIENGINYFDTAYVYHQGQSEIFLGKTLKKNNWREKINIATKLPSWNLSSKNDLDKIFEEQLKRLQTDYVDFYLLHSLDLEQWNLFQKFDALNWLDKKIQEGKIKYAGFSFHDDFLVFEKIINSYNWTFCLLQHDLLDIDYQAGINGINLAYDKNIAVVTMEPLKGGKLVNPSPNINSIWEEAENKRTPVQWAFDYLWDNPQISVVLSGMSSPAQLKENIEYANKSKANSLTDKDKQAIEKVRQEYQKIKTVPCTKCNYCSICPQKINIPIIFEIYNDFLIYNQKDQFDKKIKELKEKKEFEKCLECKKCESICPQKIKIVDELKNVLTALPDNK